MMENSYNIIRFSEGYLPDLLFTLQFAGRFLFSCWPALLLALGINYCLDKHSENYRLPLFLALVSVTVFCGFEQFSRLDYSLEAIGYMAAAASGVTVFLLLCYFGLPASPKIWQLLPFALIFGILAAVITLNLHQDVEKFTYFSEKLYQQISISKIRQPANSQLALFSFGFYIGLAEEFCKFLFLLLPFWSIISKGRLVEILLITLFVGSGFALYENIIYAYNYGINISLVRNLFNGHLFFAMVTGWLLSLATEYSRKKDSPTNLIILIIPVFLFISLLHAGWDFVAVNYAEQKLLSYLVLGGGYLLSAIFCTVKIYQRNISDKRILLSQWIKYD